MQTPKQATAALPEMPIRRPVHAPMPIPLASGSGPAVVPFSRWQKACDRVSSALLGGETRVVVTGPPGIGKTLLLDHISRVLRAADWTVMLRLADAAAPPRQHGTVALLVDEADRLSRDALQQLLAATPGAVVLAGLDVLRSRVPGATEIALSPLGHDETQDYIAQWLALSGRAPGNLEAAAMERTIEISGGVPRLASTLLGAAAWLADSVDATVISVRHVEEAAALRSCFVPGETDLDLPVLDWVGERERTNTPLLMAVAASMLLLGAGAYVVTRYYPAETGRATGAIRDLAFQLQNAVSERLNPRPTDLGSVRSTESPLKPPMFVVVPPSNPPVPVVSLPVPSPPPAADHADTEPAPPRPMELATTPPVADPPAPAPPEPDPVAPAPISPVAASPAKPAAAPEPGPIIAPPAEPIVVVSAAPLEIARKLPSETISLLVRRGNDMMSIGDVFAARLLFGRAAEAGNADAMLEMGRTFDPSVLAQASPMLPADAGEAARWYRRAAESGNKAAGDLLQRAERPAIR